MQWKFSEKIKIVKNLSTVTNVNRKFVIIDHFSLTQSPNLKLNLASASALKRAFFNKIFEVVRPEDCPEFMLAFLKNKGKMSLENARFYAFFDVFLTSFCAFFQTALNRFICGILRILFFGFHCKKAVCFCCFRRFPLRVKKRALKAFSVDRKARFLLKLP